MADILMIGGGVAGLSAGIYAQLHGHRATVCEQHSVPGGNLTGWQREGYRIDNCIHWLSGTNPATETYRMWQELGVLRGGDVYQGQTLYTVDCQGLWLSLQKDLDRMEQELLALSPQDGAALRRLFSAVRLLQYLGGYGGPRHDQGLRPGPALQALPGLLRGFLCTVDELAGRFRHPALQAFFRGFWGRRFGALALLVVMADFTGGNGGLPVGGSEAMAARLRERFLSLGGRLELQKQAVEMVRTGQHVDAVRFSDGSSRTAAYYVLSAEPAVCLPRLLHMPVPGAGRSRSTEARFSSVHCAFACDSPAPPFRGDLVLPFSSLPGAGQLTVREFSHEPGFAPPGKSVLQTMRFCSEAEARGWIDLRSRDRSAYRRKKQQQAETAVQRIEQTLPTLRGKLRCLDIWTPATYQRYTGAEIGSYLSNILPSRTLPRRQSSRIRGLSNVVLATQWQQSPGGLPIAAERGRAAIETIDKLVRHGG